MRRGFSSSTGCPTNRISLSLALGVYPLSIKRLELLFCSHQPNSRELPGINAMSQELTLEASTSPMPSHTTADPPARKRSKWESLAEEEDEREMVKIKKKKLAAQERRRRERSAEEREREARLGESSDASSLVRSPTSITWWKRLLAQLTSLPLTILQSRLLCLRLQLLSMLFPPQSRRDH